MIQKDLIDELKDKKRKTPITIADKAVTYNSLYELDKDSALHKGKSIIELVIDSLFENNGIPFAKTENVCNRIKTLTDKMIIPQTRKHDFQYFCGTLCPRLKEPEPILDDELSEYIESCSLAINGILKWYIRDVLPKNTGKIKFAKGSEITKDMLRQAVLLDERVFENTTGLVDIDVCWAWLQKNSDIYTMGIDTETDRVVSYWNIMPISDSYFDTIKSGDFLDKQIPVSEIDSCDVPGYYKLYVCSVVIDPSFRSHEFCDKMLDAFGEKLLQLHSKGVFITDVIADGFTDAGRKMCELFGMEPVHETLHGTTVYGIKLIPPTFNRYGDSMKKLYELYKDMEAPNKDFHVENKVKQQSSVINSKVHLHIHDMHGNLFIANTTGDNSPITSGKNNVVQSYNVNESILVNELQKQGITKEQADELIILLRKEQPDTVNRTLGPSVKKWCNDVKTIGLGVLSNLIFRILFPLA